MPSKSFNNGLSSNPALNAFAVTKHDTNDLPFHALGLYVGGTGNVAVITYGGDTVTYVGLQAGVIHPIAASRVLSTGTTATSIVALY